MQKQEDRNLAKFEASLGYILKKKNKNLQADLDNIAIPNNNKE